MTAPACVIEFRACFRFAVPPTDMWSAIERVDRFERWWAWLSELRLDGDGLRAGSVLHGLVSPPLPYRMRLRVELEECEPPSLIEATIHGDLEGRAGLLLEPEGEGTRASVGWTIEMMQPPMRAAARVAHPVLRWGHDRLVENTVRSFSRHVVAEEGSAVHPPEHGRGGEDHRRP